MAQFTVHDAARAAQITRRQVDAWVSRGYIVPKHTPGNGEARLFSQREIVTLAALAEVSRLMGIDVKKVAPWMPHLHGWEDDQAILAFWPVPPAKPGGAGFYDPDGAQIIGRVVRLRDVPQMVADSMRRSLILVNIDHVESRVQAALGI